MKYFFQIFLYQAVILQKRRIYEHIWTYFIYMLYMFIYILI